MDKVIVSTVGTSLITNQVLTNEDRKLFFAQTNVKERSALDPRFLQSYEAIEKKIKEIFKSANIDQLKSMSAEINALLALQEQHQDIFDPKSIHILITTDTWSGETTAELLKLWLISKGIPSDQVEIKKISYLNTGKLSEYHIGASELVKWINEDFKFRYTSEFLYHTIFNLTGGFKILNGLMQIIGMLLKKEIVYIFEQSQELLTVPPLPIQIQYQDWFKAYGQFARKLNLGIQTTEEFEKLPITDRFVDGELTMLSEWGYLIWGMGETEFYSQSLLDPPSSLISYDSRFLDKVKIYHKTVGYRQINQQIDLLARFLHLGHNPNKLEYRPFAKMKNQNGYLIDLSSIAGAPRIVLLKKDDKHHVVLDIISHEELDMK